MQTTQQPFAPGLALTLDQARKNREYIITYVPAGLIRAQVVRFGLAEGEKILIAEVIPGGPVVLRKDNQEIALGRRLAAQIRVKPKPRTVGKGRRSG